MRTVVALVLVGAAAAAAVPPGHTCGEGATAVRIEDADFAAANVELWQCPSCGAYYWDGEWHGAIEYAAEKKRLQRLAAGIPEKCPSCGAPLYETYAYTLETATATKPSYICYRCWTVIFPDGRIMSPEDIKEFEAGRRAEADEQRLSALVEKYGWPAAKARRVVAGEVMVGDGPAEVREAWGPPAKTERAVTRAGVEEKWYYPGGRAVALDDHEVTAVEE